MSPVGQACAKNADLIPTVVVHLWLNIPRFWSVEGNRASGWTEAGGAGSRRHWAQPAESSGASRPVHREVAGRLLGRRGTDLPFRKLPLDVWNELERSSAGPRGPEGRPLWFRSEMAGAWWGAGWTLIVTPYHLLLAHTQALG